MPPNRGQGRGRGRGRGGGGARGQTHQTATSLDKRVCKPAVTKLPNILIPSPNTEGVPAAITTALPEFSKSQTFFTALERLQAEVGSHRRHATCWLGIPGKDIASVERVAEGDRQGLYLKDTSGVDHRVFVKRTHIVDPLLMIEGESICPRDGALPAPTELWVETLEKINDSNNEAYVDAVFAAVADRMVTTGHSPHWLRTFGTFPARVDTYRYNISEEFPSLRRKSFWKRNQELGLFEVVAEEVSDGETETPRQRIEFSDVQEIDVGDFEIAEVTDTPNIAATITASEGESLAMSDAESVQLNSPAVRIHRITSSGSSSSTSTDDDTASSATEDYLEHYAVFKDFPVQVTLLEHAEGTLEDLLDALVKMPQAEKEAHWTAWLFQVIAGLTAAQHWFGFVHNDLHNNNVMWERTTQTHINYRIHAAKGGATYMYRVPTYGYVMKIIDFGRASFWLPEPAGFFISDAFYPGNDAAFQYNCEPFYESKHGKRIEPNPSFDLCRLAVSMIEPLFPTPPEVAKPIKVMSRDGNKTYAETTSALYNLLWEWLTDDTGKNVLRKPDGEERYPDFDLYAAIAADVHRAIPVQQIEKPIFARAFKIEGVAASGPVYDLWLR